MNLQCTFVISLVVELFPGTSSLVLDYSCDPSGSITVVNPDNETYIGAHAETQSSAQNCTVNVVQGTAIITIDDCPLNENITFWLLQSPSLPAVLTGKIDFHILYCQQIGDSGVVKVVTDDTWFAVPLSTMMEPAATPKITLITDLEDMETGASKNTAVIGEPLRWVIEGPEDYVVLPLNCTVRSGHGAGVFTLVSNGCSLDTYLLSHFEYSSPTQHHIIVAELHAFRFASSTKIVIICEMLGCHRRSTACDLTCPSEGRRKRDQIDQRLDELGSRHREQRSRDLYETQDEANGQFYGEVRVALNVLSPEEFHYWQNGSEGFATPYLLFTVSAVTCATTLVVYN